MKTNKYEGRCRDCSSCSIRKCYFASKKGRKIKNTLAIPFWCPKQKIAEQHTEPGTVEEPKEEHVEEATINTFGPILDYSRAKDIDTTKKYVLSDSYFTIKNNPESLPPVEILTPNTDDEPYPFFVDTMISYQFAREVIEAPAKYRPYKSRDEFLNDYNSRFGHEDQPFTMPIIFVKFKDFTDDFIDIGLITDFEMKGFFTGGYYFDFTSALEQVTYMDGSKLGIKEKA